MKNLLKYFLIAVLSLTTLAMVACDPEDPKPEVPEEPAINPADYAESPLYMVSNEGRELTPGEVVVHAVTADELADATVIEEFRLGNKTISALNTAVKMEMFYGPKSYSNVGICIGNCQSGTVPFTCSLVEMNPSEELNLELEAFPEGDNEGYNSAIYKVTVGRDEELAEPFVFFLKLTF